MLFSISGTNMSRLVGKGQRINSTIRRLQFELEEQQGLGAQLSASFSRRHDTQGPLAYVTSSAKTNLIAEEIS